MNADDGRAGIDVALVRRLLEQQFPQWAGLDLRPVAQDGWDNRTYRLGDELTVRLPTAEWYVEAVAKENRWLPWLAPRLPLPIPQIAGAGVPSESYPYPWSVRRWLDGETATAERVTDPVTFARDLAGFLNRLRELDTTDGPLAGPHCFWRGASLEHYDAETRRCAAELGELIDVHQALKIWDDALAATHQGQPVWFHGDVAEGNLLVDGGKLCAVIDFGTCGVGDPACDLVIAWTLLRGEGRAAFTATVDADDAMWARARGWALWKELLELTENPAPDAVPVSLARGTLGQVLPD